MKNKTGFFEQFYLALMKHRLYKKLLGLTRRQHAAYFMGITFLLTLISYVVPMASLLVGIGGYKAFFTDKLPAFLIAEGELSIETPLDFYLNQVHIVANADVKEYTKEDLASQEEYVLFFSKTNAVTNLSPLPMGFQYSMLEADRVDNQYMASLAPRFYGTVAGAGLVAWISQMLSYAFLALLFAVCGMGANRLSGANLPFSRLYCIALYAETMFALLSHMIIYFVTGILAYIVYFIGAMISMRAMNTGILLHVIKPPEP
ncbi:MAG: DUF1189 domain-containing protein [Lachnospiraceae bacterium]|nr:DUF1189 domain-containing protein [Lachnospiraceae bacterium]